MKTITSEQIELIKKPLPKEAISQHPTKTFLSSIKAIYVTERLNDVFGIGAWSIKTEHVETGNGSMVVVKVTFEVKDYGIYYECFGGNNNGGENSKNFDLGDAYKGATTDAITKIASYMGIGADVFKGLSSAPKQQQSKPQTASKPQFTSANFEAAVKASATREMILARYSATEEVLTQYEQFKAEKNGTAK